MQVLIRALGQRPDHAVWESREFASGDESGPTRRDRRATLERVLAVEAPGDPESDGPFRRVSAALLRYDIFPPRLVTGVLRGEPLQSGDSVGTCYHLMPGIDLFFASRVVRVFDEKASGVWRCGFTYRTLIGHPVIGEETFSVEKDITTGQVTAALCSWSRPGILIARLARPLMRWLQFRAGRAALDHLQSIAIAPASASRSLS